MERCGSDSSIAELTDFICADQMAKATDALLMKQRKLEKKLLNEDDHAVHLSILMIGSGVPTEPDQITQRTLPEDAIGSPYFYYEQIHLSNPMIGFGVYTKPDQITQRTLSEDAIGSPYFYYEQIHLSNPMIGFGVYTKPDQITQRTLPEDAIGSSYLYYEHMELAPDPRTKLNCLQTCTESAKLTEKICKALEAYDNEPPSSVQKYISLKTIHEDLYRDMFHGGINVLSLFSGINDAEVAFYCLGILLKTDVQELNDDWLEQLMSSFVEFDLVVSGIQRNNLTGRNKHHHDELEDFCWCIFLQ
ncbi:hypothetical protein F3Y22_tig00003715pilonHSYRG00103 [Hibiscus syriacus]|uniref:Uncharacterized protein n=1 Tax=Hibiscus syriacus TaxID=106335 RepID=A0A6A3CQI7_HIBSY|nr:hypothetical protein F3Y22_tig00003715pilonHSYRG00103 [Hibiscus syriacus]